MDADQTVERAVEAIASLYERAVLARSPLHLAGCGGCGGPTFQQPCPLCDFYPMGADKGRWHPETASRQFFCDKVAGSAPQGTGNLATWVLSALKKSVAYARNPVVRDRLDAALADAVTLDMPDPGLVYDRVSGAGMIYGRVADDHGRRRFWEAASLLKEACHDEPRVAGSSQDRICSVIADAVSDLHAGRFAAACGTLRAAASERLDRRHGDPHAIRRAIAELDAIVPEDPEEETAPGPRP
ncbi:hypothetical protein BHAOGJBA_4506 [Methylobacterium hispanicum]|uniref:Uncharacterized protein n=1 Tax=Methylobacterium hispanicum TaxID=270350 RepID=A0AAV4ZRY3_9HYPH|nr:hypothetical protein [Methylobacterium hispanicum]GJD90962.1 hypothetical protein BHAOGJBA_4506 [Methylobacterium hispanicum]